MTGSTTLTASVSAPASVRSDQTLTYTVHVANTGAITAHLADAEPT